MMGFHLFKHISPALKLRERIGGGEILENQRSKEVKIAFFLIDEGWVPHARKSEKPSYALEAVFDLLANKH